MIDNKQQDPKQSPVDAETTSRRSSSKAAAQEMVDISPVRTPPMTIRRRRHSSQPKHLHYQRIIMLFGCFALTICTIFVVILFQSRGAQERPYRKAFSNNKTTLSEHGHYLRNPGAPSAGSSQFVYDVIVVGSGLAGMSATLEILDRGGHVALIEKEPTLGGNSLKASSGMNACCENEDTEESFVQDTTKSAGELARPPLIHELVGSSANALQWFKSRVGVDLSQIAQLGGHSHARTHRPLEGMVGAELIVHLEQLIRTYTDSVEGEGQLHIFTNTHVTQLLQQRNQMEGAQVQTKNSTFVIRANQIVLATGGFASDRRPNSLLAKVRPDLLKFGTTGGPFSTGDGIALASDLGANTVDMKEVQLHPTGFVDPSDSDDGTKVLAAELLRGVGGILLNNNGERFCNELGTRDYVTGQMMAQENRKSDSLPTFTVLLLKEAAVHAQKHVDLYQRKGLLTEVQGIDALAKWMSTATKNKISPEAIHKTFGKYQSAIPTALDEFGKTSFQGFPSQAMDFLQWEQYTFYVGTVTPVLHYCMGGVAIDTDGHVLNPEGNPISGLYAAGEVTGGVHGKNRLGGNSLLECAVFGRRIGHNLKVSNEAVHPITPKHKPHESSDEDGLPSDVHITTEYLERHSQLGDLWMALHGWVYNLTEFANRHPGGAGIIQSLAGSDATGAFATVHSKQLLQPFQQSPQSLVVGKYDASSKTDDDTTNRVITDAELKQHSTSEDCWVALHGVVYDLTRFSIAHPGGAYLIQKHAGKDATDTYKVFHKKGKLELVANRKVGIYEDSAVINT